MNKYKLTVKAEEDLWRIYRWGYSVFGEIKADEYHYKFLEQFENIANQPYLFSTVDSLDKEYRSCPCGADVIYYQINGQRVDIIRILGRQDIGKHL